MGSLPKISVVTVLKNRFENFRLCVRFLSEVESVHLVEHVVVDFRSDDGDVRSLYDGILKFKHIVTDRPFSLNVGRNLGVENAASDVIFLCDADIIVDKRLVKILDRHVKLGQMFFPIVRDLESGCDRENLVEAMQKPENLGRWRGGRGMCGFNRKDWQAIGRFDEERFKSWGMDDIDFFERARTQCKIIRHSTNYHFYHCFHDRSPAFLNRYYGE